MTKDRKQVSLPTADYLVIEQHIKRHGMTFNRGIKKAFKDAYNLEFPSDSL